MEDQQKFLVPLNDETEKIYYNQRMIIDNKVKTEPRTWQVTKVNRLNSFGLCLVTLAQHKFNEHTDYIELDDKGNVIGMWADYYSSNITPSDYEPQTEELTAEITYSGLEPQIKIGGSYKKFTIVFDDGETHDGTWSFEINSQDASDLVKTIVDGQTIKVKFIGDIEYLNQILIISYTTESSTYSVQVEILSL